MDDNQPESKPNPEKFDTETAQDQAKACNDSSDSYLEPMRFAEKLRRLMEEKGWSQAILAERTGVPLGSLKNYLNADDPTEPGVQNALAIARTLGVDPFWLFDDQAKWPPIHAQELLPVDPDSPEARRILAVLASLVSRQLKPPSGGSTGPAPPVGGKQKPRPG